MNEIVNRSCGNNRDCYCYNFAPWWSLWPPRFVKFGVQTNWYLWCSVTITNLGLSKCDHGLWEPTCCRTEIPSGFSQTTLIEISVLVRVQFKLPALFSDSSDIREGWTQKKTMEFEWSCSCHWQPTTCSISAMWCAARRLNTACPWASRQRSYSSPPNNDFTPSAMVAETCKLKPKRPKGGWLCW